jgi:uncharacterized protein YcgI (DUF1989 family)
MSEASGAKGVGRASNADRTAEGRKEAIPETPSPEGYHLRLEVLIPAREARAIRVQKGEILQLIDVRGQQVSDLMAWMVESPQEYLSPAHTVSCLTRVVPREGDDLFSNHRRPLFGIRRDTVGRHDLVVPCCDRERFLCDFGLQDHPSCLESIKAALLLAGEDWEPRGELAWNVFMNSAIQADGSISTREPTHHSGDYIEMTVKEDLGVVASSCPQDLTACNAWNISEVAFRVFEPIQ